MLYPTEGVWGLGCSPLFPRAVQRIIALKHRDSGKGLILLSNHPDHLSGWINTQKPGRFRFATPTLYRPKSTFAGWRPPTEANEAQARPTTYVLPARRRIHPLLTGRFRTLAVRVTRHGPARALCRNSGGVMTSTSANHSGHRKNPTSRWAVLRQFGPQVDAIVGAPLGGLSRPSRIFDTVSGQWIRQ